MRHMRSLGEQRGRKRSDIYRAMVSPGKAAEDLKGAIDWVKAALKITSLRCLGYKLSLVPNSIGDSGALQ